MASSATALVTLQDLIGDTSGLVLKRGKVSVRGGLSVAYWLFSSPDPAHASKPTLVALHGGPSFTHNYILPLLLLTLEHGYPVCFYDQAGCGESDRGAAEEPEKDCPWLLTVEYYVEELRAVLRHLDLPRYYVYGSSWGSMLAQEYAVSVALHGPPSPAHAEGHGGGLLGLILDGALCDGQHYIKSQWQERIAKLPSFTQKLLRRLEDEKDYDSPAYAEIEEVLTSHFTVRLVPKPDCWLACFEGLNKKIYVGMQGASEFTFGGVLENWKITDRLHLIKVPTLVVRGEFDTMTEAVHQEIVDAIPHAHPLVTIPRAGHCKLIDEPQLCCSAMAKFLGSVQHAHAHAAGKSSL